MDTKQTETKERFLLRIEPSLLRRCEAVANARFGGNKSLVIRKALEQFVDELESELGTSNGSEAA